MTPDQLKIIHIAKKELGLNDAQYRMILKNTAHVASAKDLTNTQLEDVMAVMEAQGFRHVGRGATYWRDKVSSRGQSANVRMVHRIRELAPQQRYELPALCLRVSQDRTDDEEKLTPKEAWNLIEMLKSAVKREDMKHEPRSGAQRKVTEDAGELLPF